MTDKPQTKPKVENERTIFNQPASDINSETRDIDQQSEGGKSVEKGLFDDPRAIDNDEDDKDKDSITEYEKIISEKLEQKRKEELKKASEHMKSKLIKTGRCPICTLAPPCNHYSTEEDIKEVSQKVASPSKASKKSASGLSQSPQKSAKKTPRAHVVAKSVFKPMKAGDKLNKTTYETDSNKIQKLSKLRHKKAKKDRKSPANQTQIVEHEAIPAIKDSEFDGADRRGNTTVQEIAKTHTTEHSEERPRKVTGSQPASVSNKHRPNANALYDITRRRRTQKGLKPQQQQRLFSHQNRTKVRIQGRHGVKSEKYVNLEQSLQEQQKHQERKTYIVKARERQKIQERIERYREEKIQREIELLEEAKRLEREERHREKVREDRR